MIVCLCVGVTDRNIRKLAAEGATTVEEVGRRCRAGTDCGACVATIACVIAEREDCARSATGLPSGFAQEPAHEGT